MYSQVGWRAILLAALAVLAMAMPGGPAAAQQNLPLTPQDLLRLMGPNNGLTPRSVFDGSGLTNPRTGRFGQRDLGTAGAQQGGMATETTIAPEPPTPLERDYSLRAKEPLKQFGYDAFKFQDNSPMPATGAIQDSYQLGVGDELQITLHGQTWQSFLTRIDSSGRVIITNLPPIPAAGRTLGDFRAELKSDVKRAMLGTEVYVSMGELRSVEVAVIGEVAQPGVYHLTSLSSVVDALVRAGGPKKTGSLRNVRLNRGGSVTRLDLYDLLIGGGFRTDITLREGDRIVVPPIGPTIAIAGQVKRPGIYELRSDKASPLESALAYAGGPLRPRGNRFIEISVGNDGREHVEELRRITARRAADGDVLIVQPGANVQLGDVWIEGSVRVPGRRSLAQARTVRQLIGDVRSLAEDAYLPFAVVRRIDAHTQAPVYLPVNLITILLGQADMPLQSSDRLIVLGRKDVEFLSSADVQSVLLQTVPPSLVLATDQSAQGGAQSDKTGKTQTDTASTGSGTVLPGQGVAGLDQNALLRDFRSGSAAPGREASGSQQPGQPGAGLQPGAEAMPPEKGLVRTTEDDTLVQTSYACNGLRTLSTIMQEGGTDRFANARRVLLSRHTSEIVNVVSCPDVFDRYSDLLAFVLQYVVAVNGEVQVPGVYPLGSPTSLRALARVAGGLTREADLTSVEISRVPVSRRAGSAGFARQTVKLDATKGATTMASVTVGPGDTVRFNRVFTQRENGPVLLSGQFRRPGLYSIRRGERLSQVIARAGGLTDQAYPLGGVFLRDSARQAQKAAFDRAAEELEVALAAQAGTGRANPAVVTAGQALVSRLRNAKPLGRVVIEADPTVLEVHPEEDVVMQPGDQLFMPRRSPAVHVSGAVLSPGTLQFSAGKRAEDYIELAGGFSDGADEDRVFLVLPNGEAKRLQFSYWNYRTTSIPPGSTIVVPRNPAPFDLSVFLRDATDIVSKMAVTAASLVVIGR